jgi:hypothetical protein
VVPVQSPAPGRTYRKKTPPAEATKTIFSFLAPIQNLPTIKYNGILLFFPDFFRKLAHGYEQWGETNSRVYKKAYR